MMSSENIEESEAHDHLTSIKNMLSLNATMRVPYIMNESCKAIQGYTAGKRCYTLRAATWNHTK